MAENVYGGPKVTGSSAQPVTVSGTWDVTQPKRPKGKRVRARREKRRAAKYYAGQEQAHADAVRESRKNPAKAEAKTDPLADYLKAAVQTQYGGVSSALKHHAQAIPGYFTDYKQMLQSLQGQQAAQYQNAMGQVGALGQQLATGSANVLAAARGEQQAGAAQIGATANQGVLDDAAKAAAIRQGLVGNFGGLIASQGANENAYLGNRQASSGPLEIKALLDAAREQQDLAREIGAYKSKTKYELGQAEADRAAEAQKLQAAYAIAGINNKADITQSKITGKTSRAGNRSRERQNREDNQTSIRNNEADNAASERRDRRKVRVQRHKDSRKVETRLDDINGRWKELRQETGLGSGGKPIFGIETPTVTKLSHHELVGRLVGDGFKTSEIRLARLIHRGKTFTKQDMKIARDLGLIVPDRLRPKKGGKGG